MPANPEIRQAPTPVETGGISTHASGSQAVAIHSTRMSKVYLIYEVEFSSLGTMNFLTTVFFSLALALWSLGAGIIISLINCDTLKPESSVLLHYGPWVLGVLGLACIGIAIWAHVQSVGIKDRVRKESVERKL